MTDHEREHLMTIRRFLAALLVAAGLTAAGVTAAQAAPITCPNGQTPGKVGTTFVCVNNGGNASNAAETKNPND
jgi:hypothetical protein